jgi:hypothetical protein
MAIELSQKRIAEITAARIIASSRDEMARILHIDPSSAGSYIRKLNLPRFGLQQTRKCGAENVARNARIIEMQADGYSLAKIADEIEASRSLVAGVLYRAGLMKKRGPRKERQKKPPRTRTSPRGIPTFAPVKFNVRKADIVPVNVSFDQLERDMCRYAYGDGPFTFCGNPRESNHSWCPDHCMIVYKPVEARVRNARPR